VSTGSDPAPSRFRYWLTGAAVVAGIGIAAFLIFLLVVRTVYAWGFFGAFLFVALVFLVYGWFYDRRHKREEPDPDDYSRRPTRV
jgi:membrane protein implicated in regulation of membrane protease activity